MNRGRSLVDRGLVEDALHELNRRVGALVAEASLLKESLDEVVGDARRPAELMIEDVERLRKFVHRLATFVRTSGTVSQVDGAGFDLVEVCREVGGREAPAGSVAIDAPLSLSVNAPRPAVAEAIALLVENAVTHGGGKVEIRVGSSEQHVEVEIADRGPGLPAAVAGRPFDPFAASRAGLRGTGSGLGLALADVLVRSAGGTLAYRSGSPGARFALSLPRDRRSEAVTQL